MSWIKSFQELRDHPKTKRAARMLGIEKMPFIGYLHGLWWWALSYAEDGSLAGYGVEDIAEAAEWKGDSADFVNALLNCGINGKAGFLEQGTDGALRIHDWDEYAGKLIDRRTTERDRQRERRGTAQQPTNKEVATLQQHTQDVAPSNNGRVEKSREEKKEKKEKRETTAKSRPVTPPEDLQEFDSILRAVPAYSPTENYYQQVCKFRPTVDLCLEANKMVGWIKGQSKTKGTTAFVLSWLERANNEKHIPKIEPVPWVGKVYVQGN